MTSSSEKLVDEEVCVIGFPANAGIGLSESQVSEKVADIVDKCRNGKGMDIGDCFLSQQLQFVLTKGTICQTARDDASKTTWLQHTASVAQGSSGGPLVLADGTVVGINTLIVSRPEGVGAEFYRSVSVGQLRSEIDRFVKDAVWIQ